MTTELLEKVLNSSKLDREAVIKVIKTASEKRVLILEKMAKLKKDFDDTEAEVETINMMLDEFDVEDCMLNHTPRRIELNIELKNMVNVLKDIKKDILELIDAYNTLMNETRTLLY